MSEKRLTPEAQDQLARQLRENLHRRQRRPLPWTLLSVIFVVLVLSGLWYVVRPTGQSLPPLMLTCFDAVDGDELAEAQLVAPSDPDANLEGLDIQWQVLRRNIVEEAATTKTDRSGATRYSLGTAPTKQKVIADIEKPERELRVSFVDPAGGYRRDCHALLAPMPRQPLIVAVSDLIPDDGPIAWTSATSADLPAPRPVSIAKDEHEIAIFATGTVEAATYRSMRAWLRYHQARPNAPLPRGPLLRERPEDLEMRLRKRAHEPNVVRWLPGDNR